MGAKITKKDEINFDFSTFLHTFAEKKEIDGRKKIYD